MKEKFTAEVEKKTLSNTQQSLYSLFFFEAEQMMQKNKSNSFCLWKSRWVLVHMVSRKKKKYLVKRNAKIKERKKSFKTARKKTKATKLNYLQEHNFQTWPLSPHCGWIRGDKIAIVRSLGFIFRLLMPFGPIQRYFNIIYMTGDDCAMNPKGLFQKNDVSVLSVSLKASSRPQSVVTTHHQYLPTRLSKYFAIQEPHQGKLFKGLNGDIFQTAAVPWKFSPQMKPAAPWQDNKPYSSLEKPLCIGSDALCRGKRKIMHCHFEIKKMANSGEIINYKNPINAADDALQNLPQSTASPTLASHQKQSPISSNKKVVGKRKWNLGWRQSLNGQKHQRPAVFPPGVGGGGLTEATLNHWRVPQVSAEKHWWRKSPFQQHLHTDK